MSDGQKNDSQEFRRLVSRRSLLKVAAGAPLAFTFSMMLSPLTRVLRPSMQPGGFFQTPDFPVPERNIAFNLSDFPNDWTSKSFDFRLKYSVFSPEQEKIRSIPGIIVRLSADEFVAFSLKCPNGRGCLLNYKTNLCCGCINNTVGDCSCERSKSHPVLVCPEHHSTFDLMNEGCVVSGPAPGPPWRFNVLREGDSISIIGCELAIA